MIDYEKEHKNSKENFGTIFSCAYEYREFCSGGQ